MFSDTLKHLYQPSIDSEDLKIKKKHNPRFQEIHNLAKGIDLTQTQTVTQYDRG